MRTDLKMRFGVVLLSAFAMCAHAGTVLTTDGALHEGALSIDRGIVVRGSSSARLPISGILRARFAPANPDFQPGLLLVNGGRIAGKFSPLGEETVKIEPQKITIPSKEIAWAIFHSLTPALAAQVPRGKTGALLQGGDFFEGKPRGGDVTSARVLSVIFGPRSFSPPELLALVLRNVQPQSAAFDVLTRDGSIYPALDVLAGDGGDVILRHPLYHGMRVPSAELVEIRASATRFMPIDDIKPTRVDPAPNRDAATCFSANRALDSGPLKLGSQVVTAGFECATGAAVWWKPPPGPGVFFALVAAGADTPPGQRLTFTVYADGKLSGRSIPLAAGDPPAVMRCAVPGRESLALRIDGADGTGVWAEPMLLRR